MLDDILANQIISSARVKLFPVDIKIDAAPSPEPTRMDAG